MTPTDAFPWHGLFIGYGAHSWCNPGKSLPPAGMHHLPPLGNADRCGGRLAGSETKKRSEAWYSNGTGDYMMHPTVQKVKVKFAICPPISKASTSRADRHARRKAPRGTVSAKIWRAEGERTRGQGPKKNGKKTQKNAAV